MAPGPCCWCGMVRWHTHTHTHTDRRKPTSSRTHPLRKHQCWRQPNTHQKQSKYLSVHVYLNSAYLSIVSLALLVRVS